MCGIETTRFTHKWFYGVDNMDIPGRETISSDVGFLLDLKVMIKYMGERIISFIKQGIPDNIIEGYYMIMNSLLKVFDGIQLLEVCVPDVRIKGSNDHWTKELIELINAQKNSIEEFINKKKFRTIRK